MPIIFHENGKQAEALQSNKIKDKQISQIMTDYWEGYVGVIPKKKHIQ